MCLNDDMTRCDFNVYLKHLHIFAAQRSKRVEFCTSFRSPCMHVFVYAYIAVRPSYLKSKLE